MQRTRSPALPLLTLLPVLTAITVLLGGCSDDEATLVEPSGDRIRSGLAALWAGDHATAGDKRAAACFAEELTARTDPEQLRRAGILDASSSVVEEMPLLDRDMAQIWVDAEWECTDFVAESARAQVAATHGKVDESAYAECLRRALPDAQLREAVVQTLTGHWDGGAVTALSRAQQTCAQQSTPG